MSLALFGLTLLSANWVEAQPDDGDAPMTTVVYNIADLLEPTLLLDGADEEKTDGRSNWNGMMGGAGGGAMGGGGMFRVPDKIKQTNRVLGQFGGQGGGGLGGGGLGGFGMVQSPHAAPNRLNREALKMILQEHGVGQNVKWMELDGEGGVVTIVGQLMIVTQTAEGQKYVTSILESLGQTKAGNRNVQIDLRVVEIEAGQALESLGEDPKTLESLAKDASAARLALRCQNHHVAEISSGMKRTYIVSLTPVVGAHAAPDAEGSYERGFAYQPVTESILLGLFGKIKPDVNNNGDSARLNLGIQVASGPQEVIAATFGTGESIDRVEIETARLQTSVEADPGTWTLAGSVAVCDPSTGIRSGEALSHIAVLVRWSPVQ